VRSLSWWSILWFGWVAQRAGSVTSEHETGYAGANVKESEHRIPRLIADQVQHGQYHDDGSRHAKRRRRHETMAPPFVPREQQSLAKKRDRNAQYSENRSNNEEGNPTVSRGNRQLPDTKCEDYERRNSDEQRGASDGDLPRTRNLGRVVRHQRISYVADLQRHSAGDAYRHSKCAIQLDELVVRKCSDIVGKRRLGRLTSSSQCIELSCLRPSPIPTATCDDNPCCAE